LVLPKFHGKHHPCPGPLASSEGRPPDVPQNANKSIRKRVSCSKETAGDSQIPALNCLGPFFLTPKAPKNQLSIFTEVDEVPQPGIWPLGLGELSNLPAQGLIHWTGW